MPRVLRPAIKAGATTLNIPDTVGYMVPEEYAARIRYLREHTEGIENVILSCHNAQRPRHGGRKTLWPVWKPVSTRSSVRSTASASAQAMPSMEECVMALNTRKDLFGVQCNIDTHQIYRASRMIQTITGVSVAPTKPIVGANAFAHESRHPPARRHGQQGNL